MLWRHLLLAVAVALTSLQISAGEKERPIPEPRTVGDKVLSDGQELDREMYASLPDFGDKAVMNRLRCGACQASVLEIAYEILRTETNMNRPCKEVEITEILEKVCDKKMDLYGLLLDKETGLPTENWSNDPVALRAKGGQITRIAMGTCSDVTNDYEDYIVNEAPKVCHIEGNEKKCQTRPLISGVCGTKGLGFCIGKDFNQMVNATQVQVPLNNGGGLPIVEL